MAGLGIVGEFRALAVPVQPSRRAAGDYPTHTWGKRLYREEREDAKVRRTNRSASRLRVLAVEQFLIFAVAVSASFLRVVPFCEFCVMLLLRSVPAEGLASRITQWEQTDDAGVRDTRARGSRGSAPRSSTVALRLEPMEKGEHTRIDLSGTA